MPSRTKSRRRRYHGRAGTATTSVTAHPQGQDTPPGVTSKVSSPSTVKAVEPNYQYVYRDLKYFALISGGIIAIYLILYFIWR